MNMPDLVVVLHLGEFRREDLARAWLNYVALDLTQLVYTTCRWHGMALKGSSAAVSAAIRWFVTSSPLKWSAETCSGLFCPMYCCLNQEI